MVLKSFLEILKGLSPSEMSSWRHLKFLIQSFSLGFDHFDRYAASIIIGPTSTVTSVFFHLFLFFFFFFFSTDGMLTKRAAIEADRQISGLTLDQLHWIHSDRNASMRLKRSNYATADELG